MRLIDDHLDLDPGMLDGGETDERGDVLRARVLAVDRDVRGAGLAGERVAGIEISDAVPPGSSTLSRIVRISPATVGLRMRLPAGSRWRTPPIDSTTRGTRRMPPLAIAP